ncbi:MAG: precorrin-2 C(20)-methyltransferase [Desulfitobacteriaceae bacterium]|nr:precorrin-2 C(20)-methyltransferase [Clostridia bacterium]MDD4346155.1 precorrin-2 C(20)-methyltransferase [Desulfitobacteriaceae bacterium]MDD4400622.1 precorrin-2 C(20)-methyltransferase [Desulfitobacteriaceae bacterium]
MNGVFFYGVGIGPGDPDLLTVKAARVIREAKVVVVPRVGKETGSTALAIAGAYIPEKTRIVQQVFPMAYDAMTLQEAWQKNADEITGFLQAGKTVAFLTLGDPMLYSTYIYMHDIIVKQGFQVETVPGISSFCSIAARLGLALGEGDEILSVVPATAGEEVLDKALEFSDNMVLLKASHHYDRLVDSLARAGRLDGAVLVDRCGLPGETIRHDLRNTDKANIGYLSTIIVKKKSARKEGKRL